MKLYVGDSNNTSKKPKKSYVGYNGKAVEVFVQNEPKVYGVAWDGSATTTWTRTDDAKNFSDPNPYYSGMSGTPSSPFDDIQPWAGMVVSEISKAGTVVAIPKFYYKLEYADGLSNGIKIQIAPASNGSDWAKENGYSVCPACMNRGDGKGERDVAYIGRYHCATGGYKSETGKAPQGNGARSNYRTSIHNLGSNVWQSDFAMRFTIWLLYLVEFADWNSQAKIGFGGSGEYVATMGYTDSMPYHTGTTQSSRSTYGLGTQYRNIEGLWENGYDWVDGYYYSSNGINIVLKPSNFSEYQSGILIGKYICQGYPSKFVVLDVANTFPMFLATEGNGSYSTYSCDEWYIYDDTYYQALCIGGTSNTGLFYISGRSANASESWIHSRLMILP